MYEEEGLIAPQGRTEAGYRQYGADTLDRLRVILHLKELGLTLAEIALLLSDRDQGVLDEQAVQRLDALQPGLVAADERSRQLVSDFRHDDIIRHADFRTPYTPQTTLPLGESPMLLTDVNMRLQGQELQLELIDQSGEAKRQCEMKLNSQLVHGWLHLMTQVSQQARWGLGGGEDTAAATEASAPAPSPQAWQH